MRDNVRVVIRGMSATRGPGDVQAIIMDAANLGASTYFNAGGEFHMTLPTNHPQVGLCEPWQSHYAVEELFNGVWTERFAGIISDFDANENDCIIYGIDYLALLDKVIDTRYVQGSPETPPPTGSKYVQQTLRDIVRDLLTYARAKDDSPVEFIAHNATFIGPMSEKVTIYSTFTAIRSMIDGLVESHRQGTGKRTRFWVARAAAQTYRFQLDENPGVDRTALKLEYGSLVQGFQVVGFGDFAVKAHGIGRTQTGYELFYKSASAPGMATSTWGNIETVAVYDNVADANDLHRRVKQAAAAAGRVGKRIAIGIRVDHLSPFDGYNIADNVPVHIKRGVIDTTRWGSGLWSIYGVEWRVGPLGNMETSLILTPKEDGVAPNPDLLVDNEVLNAQIVGSQIADGAIGTSKLQDGAVTNPILAPQAVTGDKVEDDAIDTQQLAPDAVDSTILAPQAVQTGNFDPAAKAPLAGTADNADLAALATAALQADFADMAEQVENSTAKVIIDASGLTILDGAISLEDYSGVSVLTPSGFGGSWVEFIQHGVYNASFNAGADSAGLTAVTEVAGYDASLSAAIPGWVVSQRPADTTYGLHTAGDGERSLRVAHVPTGPQREVVFYQDIPVVAGKVYDILVRDSMVTPHASSACVLNVQAQWRDAAHATTGDPMSTGFDSQTTIDAANGFVHFITSAAPADARFVRLYVATSTDADAASGTMEVHIKDVTVRPSEPHALLRVGPWELLGTKGYHELYDDGFGKLVIEAGNGVTILNSLTNPAIWLGTSGGISFGGDVVLDRLAANVLGMTADTFSVGSTDTVRIEPSGLVRINTDTVAIAFGPDSSTAVDVSLSRSAADVLLLATGDIFSVESVLMRGRERFQNMIAPASLTGATNDYNPAGLATANIVRLASTLAVNLSGLATNAIDGERVMLMNAGSFTITLLHQSALTTVANRRFVCPSAANFSLVSNGMVELVWDGTSARWRVLR